MLSILNNRRHLYKNHKNIMEYSLMSTKNSVRRMIEGEKLLHTNIVKTVTFTEPLSIPSPNTIYTNSFAFFTLLSITYFVYFLHQKK